MKLYLCLKCIKLSVIHAYMLNKITKTPFRSVKRNTQLLELIHSDLYDFHSTPSLGNKKYIL